MEAQTLEKFAGADPAHRTAPASAITVNTNSLLSRLLPALVGLHAHDRTLFDVRTEDHDHAAELLRDGSVLGAIMADTSTAVGIKYSWRVDKLFTAT
jgi:LysR family transcriptional regulator (chromosome initiation inhibitor)